MTIPLPLGAAGGFDPLSFDPSAFALTVITFLALLVILRLVAWKPILSQVEAREKRIQDAIAKSEADRAAASKLLEEHQRTLAGVEADVAALRERGRLESEGLRRNLVGKAQEEAAAALAKARNEIEQARLQALQDIRREAVTLSLAAAGRVVGRSLDGADQRRIAEEVVGGLSSVGGSKR
ncbi:MAG TPA: ATP synthase F0 subunit B [Planctomycetota bacterium]|nr:ATP synthase F0 subunit B [Planctomycetota bacterium]